MQPFVAPAATTTATVASSAGALPAAQSADEAQILADRERRRAPVAEIAPAPLPTALPLIGPAGRSADGYPTQSVDQAAFRSLVLHDEHAALNRYFEELQAAFEADPRKEYWPTGAADAFASPDRVLSEAIDRWLRATPDHFAPLLARATHREAVASSARGTKWAKDTPASDFAAMEAAQSLAKTDLERAIAARPRLVAAQRLLLRMAMSSSKGDARAAVDRALATCPGCLQIRAAYLHAISPRWGGSLEAMSTFAAAVPLAENPRLRLLPGFVELERAADFATEGKKAEALAAAEKACALGEFYPFLADRARHRSALGDDKGALADLDRAVALAPSEIGFRFQRARLHLREKRPEAAANDLRVALRVAPTYEDAAGLHERTVKALVYAAWEHDTAGRREDALRLLDLAADLAPGDADVVKRRVGIVMRGPHAGDLPKLEAAAKAAPKDFRAHQALDYALAKRKEHDRVVAMWDAFVKRVPQEPRAYQERGGAFDNLGKTAAALADYEKACGLGSSEGCLAARRARSH